MALPGVYQIDTDGNIGRSTSNFPAENVCGMLFDISGRTDFFKNNADFAAKFKDTVVELNNYEDFTLAGITDDILDGIALYHLKMFANIAGNNGFRLFVAFADCKDNWNALVEMQKAANGRISQFGVWTEQALWDEKAGDEFYSVNLVQDIQAVMDNLANKYYSPAVVLLNANTAKVGASTIVDFDKLPDLTKLNSRYVAVLLGQESKAAVRDIQKKLTSKAPVGNMSMALGFLTRLKVSQSIGWVEQCNLNNFNVTEVEMGFGDLAKDVYGKYESFNDDQLGELHGKGYIFLRKYMGETGVWFSSNATCSNGDYCKITRNRAMSKSRREIRSKLLPYVNAPIKVDPSNGQMHPATISIFKDKVQDTLNAMATNEEISGIGTIVLDPTQNVLRTDCVELSYTFIPFGEAVEIRVKESLVVSRQ